MSKQPEEQKMTFSGRLDTTFSADGDYFQFANEHEAEKFWEWFKKLDMEHRAKIATSRQQAVDEYREKMRANVGRLRQWLNERSSIYLVQNKDIEYWLFNER